MNDELSTQTEGNRKRKIDITGCWLRELTLKCKLKALKGRSMLWTPACVNNLKTQREGVEKRKNEDTNAWL